MISPKNCHHKNIQWQEFQKKLKNYQNKAYCVDCGATESKSVARAIWKWYCEKIEEWLKNQNCLTVTLGVNNDIKVDNSKVEWREFLKKNDFWQNWQDAHVGRLDPDYFKGLLKQGLLFEFAKSIEQLCEELVKEKQAKNNISNNNPNKPPKQERGNSNHNQLPNTPEDSNLPVPKHHKHKDNSDSKPNREREREREREQIQQSISNLENKPNKTDAEQQELDQKRKQLEQLEQNSEESNSKEPTNYLPWVIGLGIVCLVIVMGVYYYRKKKKV